MTIPPVSLSSSHTLQGMIELVYVKAANNLLYTHMTNLNNSLTVNQQVLDALTTLQNLHNLVKSVSKGAFDFDYHSSQGSFGGYNQYYTKQASAFFGTPVQVQPTFFSAHLFSAFGLHAIAPAMFSSFDFQNEFATPILNVKTQLSTVLIPALSAITSPSAQADPNSLLAIVRKVLNDINTTRAWEATSTRVFIHSSGSIFAGNFHINNISAIMNSTGAYYWLTDSYNLTNALGVTSAGAIQQRITNAMTAAESLNTTQTEKVRSFLFLFEEYYKSAAAILTQMTQTIQKMAQNITR